jgi:hypothetical protein
MTRFVTLWAVVLVAWLAAVVAARQVPAPPSPEQQQLQALVSLYQAEHEKAEALAAAAVAKTQQIAQLQQALAGAPAACVADIEKANAGKTVDAKTWIIGTKPTEPKK